MWKIQILNPGSPINILDHIFKSLVRIFGLKMLKFFVANPDSGSGAFFILDPGSGMEKFGSRAREKNPGYATLHLFYSFY
jgi:hypothetical protein